MLVLVLVMLVVLGRLLLLLLVLNLLNLLLLVLLLLLGRLLLLLVLGGLLLLLGGLLLLLLLLWWLLLLRGLLLLLGLLPLLFLLRRFACRHDLFVELALQVLRDVHICWLLLAELVHKWTGIPFVAASKLVVFALSGSVGLFFCSCDGGGDGDVPGGGGTLHLCCRQRLHLGCLGQPRLTVVAHPLGIRHPHPARLTVRRPCTLMRRLRRRTASLSPPLPCMYI